MFSGLIKKEIHIPSWTLLMEYAEHDLRKEINEKGNADFHEYDKIRLFVVPKKIHIPTWKEFFDHAESGCKSRIAEWKKKDEEEKKNKKESGVVIFLKGKFDLIVSVREKGYINPDEYHDIRPFVSKGYELLKEKKHRIKK